jgi:hypothetical protein
VGTNIFVVGGLKGTGWIDDVVKFDTTNANVQVVAHLTTARGWTSACSDGTYVYVFGGETANGVIDTVTRFNPADNSLKDVGTLTGARSKTSAVCLNGKAYVFGGWDGANWKDDIIQYDLTLNLATALAHLPQAAGGTSATYSAATGKAYVFGGKNGGSSCPLNKIVEYAPGDLTSSNAAATLQPTGRYGTSATYLDGHSDLFAGDRGDPSTCTGGQGLASGIRMHDAYRGDCCFARSSQFSSARYGTSAASVGGTTWVFGGATSTSPLTYTADIWKWKPSADIGAHVHAHWLSGNSPFTQDQIVGRVTASYLDVVPFGVPLGGNGPSIMGSFLTAINPRPGIAELNTFTVYSDTGNATDAQLTSLFQPYAQELANHPNVRLVVGANEPFTSGKHYGVGDAIYRVQHEYTVWHTLSSLPFCHKFTNLSYDLSGVTWSTYQSLWTSYQDAVCYDWYPSGPGPAVDNNQTLLNLQGEASSRSKPVHILEAALPTPDASWLAGNADRIFTGRGDTFTIYYLVENQASPVDPGAYNSDWEAWLWDGTAFNAHPVETELEGALKPG